MRLKYEKVIHHAVVNNLFGFGYTKKAVTLKVVVNTTYSLQPLFYFKKMSVRGYIMVLK